MKMLKRSSGIDYTLRSEGFSFRPLPMLMALLFVGLGQMGTEMVGAFLFPDMALHAMHRSGGNSRYVIAVLREGPYFYGNSTGYLPDLMRAVAAQYSRIKSVSKFEYEIVPVSTWEELLIRANSEHVQLAFGLICPYLLRTDPKFSGIQSSIPVVHTSVKFITGSTPPSAQRSNHMLQTLGDLPNLVSVKGSPEDRLLESRKNHKRGQGQVVRYYEMDTLDNALNHIRHHGSHYVVTDASVADFVVSHKNIKGLQAVCPSKRLSHSGHLYYGFFGKNASLLKFINHLLKVLQRDGELDSLAAKYFKTVRHCD